MRREQYFYDVIYGTFWWCNSRKTTSKRCQSDTQRKLNGFARLVLECAFANTFCGITLECVLCIPQVRWCPFLLSGVRQDQVLTLRQQCLPLPLIVRATGYRGNITYSQSLVVLRLLKLRPLRCTEDFTHAPMYRVCVRSKNYIPWICHLWDPWRYFRWVRGFQRTTNLTISVVLWPLAFYCQTYCNVLQTGNIFAVTACCYGCQI